MKWLNIAALVILLSGVFFFLFIIPYFATLGLFATFEKIGWVTITWTNTQFRFLLYVFGFLIVLYVVAFFLEGIMMFVVFVLLRAPFTNRSMRISTYLQYFTMIALYEGWIRFVFSAIELSFSAVVLLFALFYIAAYFFSDDDQFEQRMKK